MNRHHDPHVRFDAGLILMAVILCLGLGSVLGWSVRSLSTRDRFLMATVAKYNAQREFYDAEIQKILVPEPKKEKPSNGK